MTRHEPGSPEALLTGLVARLRQRGRAPAASLIGLALLAHRLGRDSAYAKLTAAALNGPPPTDLREIWLLAGLARRAGMLPAVSLNASHLNYFDQADHPGSASELDLIGGAAGVALMLLFDPVHEPLAAGWARAHAGRLLALPTLGLLHGSAAGVLLLRLTGAAPEAADAVLGKVAALTTSDLDDGDLRPGGVAMCYGLPGIFAALGDWADSRHSHLPPAGAARLTSILAAPGFDETVCHGLAGALLATRVAPGWMLGTAQISQLLHRLANHLSQAELDSTFTTPLIVSLLSGPLGVALTVAECATDDDPWWLPAIGLPAGPVSS